VITLTVALRNRATDWVLLFKSKASAEKQMEKLHSSEPYPVGTSVWFVDDYGTGMSVLIEEVVGVLYQDHQMALPGAIEKHLEQCHAQLDAQRAIQADPKIAAAGKLAAAMQVMPGAGPGIRLS